MLNDAFLFSSISTTTQPTEADRAEEENRKKKLNTFTYALGAFISGGDDEAKPAPAPNLPAPISNDLLAGAGMSSPTAVSPPRSSSGGGVDVLKPSTSAGSVGSGASLAAAAAAGASRAKPPAGAPPPPGTSLTPPPSGGGGKAGRPPPPAGPPAMPGSANKPSRAKSMSPQPVSLGSFNGTTEVGTNGLQKRSSSQERRSTSSRKSGPLPPGADKIMEMGFSERKARAALERSGGDAGQAVEWLLAQPSSPGGGGGGDDDSGDEVRPPSPSTGSPPARKSLPKKSKPLKPQNPVFDQKAFTPVLIPEKPGAIVLANSFPAGGAGEGS